MATAAISEGSFQEIEPLNSTRNADWEISGTSEPGPSSPTSPMSDAMRPTSPEGLMSDEEDMEGIDDPRKKKRFRPFKSIRKLFKKKRTSKSEDDIDGALRSKSTGELNLSDTDERMFDPRPSSTTMTSSRSESSVFVPEQTTPLREGESSKSTEHISKDFAKDLSAMLARRMSPDDKGAVRPPAEDDVDKATTEETMQEEEESLKEKSFNDTDVTNKTRREPFAARRVKSMSAASPWAEKRTRYTRPSNSLGDTAYLDLDVIQTSPNSHLSHSAAKHKMSVKPKTRRATTRARISSQRNNPEPASHDASMNDSSFSNNLGDSSILSETTEESSTSSLLGNQQELPESLPPVDTPINEDTFSTSKKNAESENTESSEKEGHTDKQPKQKWSPPTKPRFTLESQQIINKRKELTSNTEEIKQVQKDDKINSAEKENNNLNEHKDKVKPPLKDEPPKAAVTKQTNKEKTRELRSNSILTPSEIVIRNKPSNIVEKETTQEEVKITETKMSVDDEDEKQERKSVRDRILLFQNTASRNNSNKSSPNEVRKVQIEVTDKNGNKQDNMSPEKTNLKINKSVKDSANGNSSYKTNLNQGESSQTSSKEQERNAQNKRTSNKWSFMPKTDSCIVCSKAVYMNEMSRSEGKVFHKACQKCTECTRTLPIGDVLLVGNKLYCRQHGSQEKMKLLKIRSEVD